MQLKTKSLKKAFCKKKGYNLMAKGHKSIGHLLLKIGLACYFIITALCLFGIGNSIKSSEVYDAVYGIFSGDVAKIVGIIVAIIVLIGGIAVAIDIFKDLGKYDNTIMFVLTIVWAVIAIVADIFGKKYGISHFGDEPLFWLLNVAKDLLIIGGIQSIRD